MTDICQIVPRTSTDACGKPATHEITFSDNEKALACQECAIYMTLLAQSFSTQLNVQKIQRK